LVSWEWCVGRGRRTAAQTNSAKRRKKEKKRERIMLAMLGRVKAYSGWEGELE
jgi:hypothetical protein